MCDETHLFKAYHLQYDSQWDMGKYIVNILKNHFIHLENVHSVICAHRIYDKGNKTTFTHNFKFSFFNKYENEWNYNEKIEINDTEYNIDDCKKHYLEYPIRDDDLMGSYYKNALDDNSFLLITSKHNKTYKSLEKKIQGCNVIDFDSVLLYLEGKSQNETVDIKKFKEFELHYLLYNYKEADMKLNEKQQQWTLLLFPYFFLTEFVGFVTVVFEGDLDINSIEHSINFLRNAQSIFYRAIIDTITDDWIEKNGNYSFIDCLKYFFPLKEMNTDSNNLYNSFVHENLGDMTVFVPPFHENSKTYMPLLIKNDDNENYYIDEPIIYSDSEMRLFAFEVISHIQWLLQRWECKKPNKKKLIEEIKEETNGN